MEWLLVVAAVAGLAGLAVVVVQRVVADTGESVAGHSARLAAAHLMAVGVRSDAKASSPASQVEADRLNERLGRRCRRVPILFADAGGTTVWGDGLFDGVKGVGRTAPPKCSFVGPR